MSSEIIRYSEKVPFQSFLAYLNATYATGAAAHMLDMFLPSIPDTQLPLSAYELYDTSQVKDDALSLYERIGFKYTQAGKISPRFYRGGIRSQLFGLHYIWLTKSPDNQMLSRSNRSCISTSPMSASLQISAPYYDITSLRMGSLSKLRMLLSRSNTWGIPANIKDICSSRNKTRTWTFKPRLQENWCPSISW